MAETFHTNLVKIAGAYTRELKVKVTDSTLKTMLTEHPFYPSLFALSDTFDKLRIENTAASVDKEQVDAIPTPFIGYLDHQATGKDFVTVTSMTANEVEYYADKNKPKRITKEDFKKNWLGVVLYGQAREESGEKDYAENHKREQAKSRGKNLLIASAILLFLLSAYIFLSSAGAGNIMSASVLLLIKMTGLTATILLLIYEIDKSNSFVRNICTAGRHTNCDAVLRSSASKIMGVSWSEAGFFYFAATFIFLLIPGIAYASKLPALIIVSLIASPYILFSIYYQWRVVKQWCPLCLTVQAVLAAELVWSVFNLSGSALKTGTFFEPNLAGFFSGHTIAFILISLLTPITIWYLLKPLFQKARQEPLYKAAYKRLLYNPETFHNLLMQQKQAPDGYEDFAITVGNPEAENTIIKVCNPYCGPCASAHPVLDEIIHQNRNVKLKLIFTASNDKDDKRGVAARHLMAIHKTNPGLTEKSLNDWYLTEKKDYESFSNKYPMNGELEYQEAEIDRMKEWCDKAEISFTPTIYINGYRLPEKYNINELKYIL